jgi:type III secretion protein J
MTWHFWATPRRWGRAWALAGTLLLAACGQTDLYTQLTEVEANEIVAAVAPAGINARKAPASEGRWAVRVDSDDLALAVQTLQAAGLPRQKFSSMGEVFRKEGLVSSPSEERVRYMYAVQQELSDTLSRIDGVLIARVHVAIPARDPANPSPKPSSAAVFIQHRADASVRDIAPSVKDLVSRSVEGLPYDNISVSFFAAAASAAGRTPAENSRGPAPVLVGGLSVMTLLGTVGFLGWRFRDAFAALRGLFGRRASKSGAEEGGS